METRLNVCVFMMCEFSLNVNMVSNLDAFKFDLVSRNNGTIRSLFVCTIPQITEVA